MTYQEAEKQAYRDAMYIINPGAVNPVAIANTLAEWCSTMNKNGMDTNQIKTHPAVIMMVAQLDTITKSNDYHVFHEAYEKVTTFVEEQSD